MVYEIPATSTYSIMELKAFRKSIATNDKYNMMIYVHSTLYWM